MKRDVTRRPLLAPQRARKGETGCDAGRKRWGANADTGALTDEIDTGALTDEIGTGALTDGMGTGALTDGIGTGALTDHSDTGRAMQSCLVGVEGSAIT